MADSTLSRARALLEAAGKATPGPWRKIEIGSSDGPFTDVLVADASVKTLDLLAGKARAIAEFDFRPQYDPPAEDGNADFVVVARNDAPDIARAYLEATDLLERLTALPSKDGALEIRSFMEGYVTAKAEARAFLAKHGEET